MFLKSQRFSGFPFSPLVLFDDPYNMQWLSHDEAWKLHRVLSDHKSTEKEAFLRTDSKASNKIPKLDHKREGETIKRGKGVQKPFQTL